MTAKSGTEAVANARSHSTYESGMCQKFTRTSWEVGSLYGSAIEAWNGSTQKHPGDRNPPTGAPCYYRGGSYGHAVVFTEAGSGEVRSTDCTSSGRVSDAALSWPEKTWGYTYLGWTGDINGVDLPLSSGGGGDDMDLQDPIDEWSPDEGTSKSKTTVGKTLNQARGYSEDAYDRIKKLESQVDKILKAVT